MKSKSNNPITILGSAILVLLTVALLVFLLVSGAPASRQVTGANLGAVDAFYQRAANAISDAAPEAASANKVYRITGTEAPKPDRNAYGSAESPEALISVISQAQQLLDGQSLFFSTQDSVYPGFGIQYYLDETILAITWKQPINGTMYTFSEIKLADASQFRRYLAGGEYGSGKLLYPSEMANTVHSVIACSGDYFEFRNAGIIVYNGQLLRTNSGADTCYIDENGDLLFTRLNQRMDAGQAQEFVDQHGILFSLAFGPVLVENGQPVEYGNYPLGEIADPNSRAALCQMGKLHYLLVSANSEPPASTVVTMFEFAKQIRQTGCQQAYALDGGQTTALMMNGVLVNQVTRGYQRKISDIIYFATAIPNP